MLEETLYKTELDSLKHYGEKEGYIPLKLIMDTFKNPSEELLDDITNYFENLGYEITRDTQEEDSEDDFSTEDIDDDLGNFVEPDTEGPTDSDLLNEEETDIKVSDFDNLENSAYQSNDIVKMYLHEIGQVELLNVTQELELARVVQEGVMAKERIDSYKKNGKELSDADNTSLQEKIDQGKAARDILIESNLRLVVNSAKKYNGRGLPFSDLIQEGNMGLMKAVVKYDPTRGYKFSTYATWWIKQAITRAIADKGRNVRIPVHMVESINRLTRTKRRMVQELHRDPSIEEIANEMKLPVEKIVELQRVAQDSVSFDTAVGDEEDSTLIDLIPDNETLNPLEYTEKCLFREEINDVLQTLTPKEEMVIRLRYGIGYDRNHTLEEVGEIMHVTRERVRQIEDKSLARLRHHSRLSRLKKHMESEE
jgi:RNA polymerase primary sigma factor